MAPQDHHNTKKEMNIMMSCNSDYALPLSVCLTSVFENLQNKPIKINAYILSGDLSEESKEKIGSLANIYNQNIFFINVDPSYFSSAPTLRWTKETYYRLLINELMPKNLDRILYLDCDIVANKPIDDFYEIDLGEFYLGALYEKDNVGPRKRLGLNANGPYFQTGVILLDVKKCNLILNYENAEKVIQSLGDKLLVVDQDVINVLFDGKIKPIDKKYNNTEITNFMGRNYNRLFNSIDRKEIEETYIFHYACGKPWNNLFPGSCEDIWYKYLKLSPYKDLYTEKFNSIKYKLLRTGLVKFLFFKYVNFTPMINNMFHKVLPQGTYAKLKNYYRRHIK